MTVASRSSLFALLAGATLLAADDALAPTATLAANTIVPIQDSDGDLLPDSLEWMLLSQPQSVDSDTDGVNDFIEAVTHELPESQPAQRPLDHEMRAMLAVHEDQNQVEHVVLHVMVRIASGTTANVTKLNTYLEFWDPALNTVRVPIDALVANGLVGFTVVQDPVEGLLVVMSSRICDAKQLQFVTPCSIGVSGAIGSKSFETGSVVNMIDGALVSYVPVSEDRFALQPMNSNPGQTGFWTQSHVCKLELVPMGSSGGSQVCQVADAGCTGQPTLRCAPDCSNQSGKLVVVPFGLGLLNGK